jgi:phasin
MNAVTKSPPKPAKAIKAAEGAGKGTDAATDAGAAFEFGGLFKTLSADLPSTVRSLVEGSFHQAKDNYERLKAAAEDATKCAEDVYETLSAGITKANLKAIEAAQSDANAAFDFVRDLIQVKSLTEAFELQASYARSQFEARIAQVREIATLVNAVVKESTRPLQESFEKLGPAVSGSPRR